MYLKPCAGPHLSGTLLGTVSGTMLGFGIQRKGAPLCPETFAMAEGSKLPAAEKKSI